MQDSLMLWFFLLGQIGIYALTWGLVLYGWWLEDHHRETGRWDDWR